MNPNATLKTSFNPFIVHKSMNDNNQDPDLNFFHESRDVQDKKDRHLFHYVTCSQLLLLCFPEVVSMNASFNDQINIFAANV